jgi:hypothetical protein
MTSFSESLIGYELKVNSERYAMKSEQDDTNISVRAQLQ